MSENIKQVAERLRELREIEGISAQSFAKLLNIDFDTYLEYEKAKPTYR